LDGFCGEQAIEMQYDRLGFGLDLDPRFQDVFAQSESNRGDAQISGVKRQPSTTFLELKGIPGFAAKGLLGWIEFEMQVDRRRPNVWRESRGGPSARCRIFFRRFCQSEECSGVGSGAEDAIAAAIPATWRY
jgi:hypothetical protein